MGYTPSRQKPWRLNPDSIERLLIHALISATDRKALCVGMDVYTAAGETVQRDLSSEDRSGWITDAGLLVHPGGTPERSRRFKQNIVDWRIENEDE